MLKVNRVDNDGLTSACPRQAKVAPLKEVQLHSTKGIMTKEQAAIYLEEVRTLWRETQHTTTARWLIVLFERGYRKSFLEYTGSSCLCFFFVVAFPGIVFPTVGCHCSCYISKTKSSTKSLVNLNQWWVWSSDSFTELALGRIWVKFDYTEKKTFLFLFFFF